MRTTVRLLIVCLLSAVLIVAPVTYRAAEAQSATLYDNFNSLLINPAKWVGAEEVDTFFGPPPLGAAEIFRGLVLGQLVLSHRLNGNLTNENGNSHILRLNVRNPQPITFMQVTTKVPNYALTTCPNNVAGGAVRIRLNGVFFNSDSSTPEDITGNVIARAEIFRNTGSSDAPNVLRVRVRVIRCLDANCDDADIFTVDAGTLVVGHSVRLSVRWDEPNGRFLFRRDNDPEVQITYPWAVHPIEGSRSLLITSFVANCANPTTVASIIATFDNFYVNP